MLLNSIRRLSVCAIMLLSASTVLFAQSAGSPPAGFPTMKSTGNPEADLATYSKAKEAWIKEHPAEYKAWQEKSAAKSVAAPASFPVDANSVPGKSTPAAVPMDYSKTGGAPAPTAVERFFSMSVSTKMPVLVIQDAETGASIPAAQAEELYQLRTKHWLFIWQPAEFEKQYGKFSGNIPGGVSAEEYRTSIRKSIQSEETSNQ